MGQEIQKIRFSPRDFARFRQRLVAETRLAREMAAGGVFDAGPPVTGFEIEVCLLDAQEAPAPVNAAFLERMNDPLATLELARFNVELNTHPHPLEGPVLSSLHRELTATWRRAQAAAESLGCHAFMTGILPTLEPQHLRLGCMSDMKRYRALNRQVLRARQGRPIHLDIKGREHLVMDQRDVMLEAATTSFQIHLQTPVDTAHRVYNAAILASAPLVAAAANAPFLFGRDLWDETRIPLFEQAVETGGYGDVARGPLRRVSFGSGFARESILECFEENLEHFPPLLPLCEDAPAERFIHLRLHNGTLWRWNRPLIGFSADGRPHIRIEHRGLPAGPTLADSLANAAFFHGLVEDLLTLPGGPEGVMAFATARDNFYQAARLGLEAPLRWQGETPIRARELILDRLLPRARRGLERLGLNAADRHDYLGIIAARVHSGQNGARWQRDFAAAHGRDGTALVHACREHQASDHPVHTWDVGGERA
ncbi:glutamate--cysteine ligase [Ectothiorhodospira mobilis]|uniref:glutamate--cysteine ligase n=1 Tax=Ectothiorhodospira mobilis TaxID=195064 RepID=UPI001904F7E3|nr:glutamate--cysteine ligase [Ectothiorhodospira mobilis]MBK1691188.1 glutamate--cysteine ligase [Ectothiorhodospira mobilis]